MKTTLTHAKNPASGWDISASASADAAEKIARAQILVGGATQYDKTFTPPINNWQQTLLQKGQYPGDNSSELIVTGDKGDDTESEDAWS
jgi:hypothetical protein